MNALDLGGSIPTIGGATILLGIIGLLGRLWLGAERRHLTELARINRAYETELARINRTHDEEIAGLKTDIEDLRTRVNTLTLQVDTERRARWHAEDVAAQARRRGGGANAV